MKIKNNVRWAMVAPTSMGVRLGAAGRGEALSSAHALTMQATSAESNVLSVAASLGLPVQVLTAFVEGSPVAAFIKGELRARNISFDGVEVSQGGPWGYRHQINIADSGFGARGPRVWNDRAGEVGRTLAAKDFDLDRLFAEGVGILHLSGLVAALAPELCLELARKAHESGTLVSFDLNYRASFWAGRETELAAAFDRIARQTDILIGNEEDFQLALGIEGPPAGGRDVEMEAFRAMIEVARAKYPQARVFATTLREVLSANRHLWGAILWAKGRWFSVEPREIEVLDRIGGGDGFVGGMLYGVARSWEPAKWVEFGWATGALAVTFATDYASPVDESQVWSVWSGNARVLR